MAKVQEPNSEVFLMDYTKGLSSAPVRQSFNIATVVNAETGTTDRVTLTSVQDLVDTYMVGGSINQRSDQTIQCLGALLGHTMVDVIRLDTGNMRVGVGSLGNIFYCTDKYTPIDFVDFVPLTDAVNINYPVLWMVIGDTLYYVGDKNSIPKDMEYTDEVDLYSTFPAIKIKSIDGGMIEEFFFGLELAGVSIYDSKSVSRFNEKINRYAGDNKDESGMPGFFNSLINTYTNDQMRIYHSNRLTTTVRNKEYIKFENTKFVYLDGSDTNDLTTELGTVEIVCYSKDNKNKEFLTKIFDKIFTKEVSITPPWGYDNEFEVKVKGGEVYLYGNFQSELYLATSTNPDNGEVRIDNRESVFSHNAVDLVSSTGYVAYLDGYADEDENENSKNKYLSETSCIIIKGKDPNKVLIFGPKSMKDSDIPVRAIKSKDNNSGIVEMPTEDDDTKKYEIIQLPEKFTGQSALMKIWDYFNENGMENDIELKWTEGYNLDFVYRNVSNSPEIQTSENVIFGEIDNVDYYEFKHESTKTNGNYATWPSLFFCVDNTCYYTGSRPELPGMSYTYINMGAGRYTIPDFLHNLFLNLKSDYIFGRVVDGFTQGFRLEGRHIYDWTGNPNAERNNVYDKKGEWVEYKNTDSGIALDVVGLPRTDDQTLYNDKFVCVGKFLTTGDQFKMEYTLNNDAYQTYNLNLTYKIDKEYQYKISFDPNAVDDFGTSLYYTIVNDSNVSNPYIFLYDRSGEIDPNYDGDTVFPNGFQYTWGSELENMKPDINDYVVAINKFTNEKYNTDNRQYQVVWDSGYANPIFAKACASVADKLYAMYPASFPTKDNNGKDAYYTKWGDYVSYRDNTGIDSPRTIFHAPVFKQMAVGNFMTTLPRSFSYLVSKINAYNSTVNEFMAIFGPNNAQISGGTQLVKFSLDEREELLGSQINTVITDSNGIYFNNNLTGQKVDSYLSEDMNIYQANLIAQVCEQYNPKILAKMNTPELWAKVKEDITGRITNRLISNKADKLNGFMVVCDGSLNTLQMIEQNTLIYEVWVMFNKSVKYVRAYVGVKRLGSF